MRGPEWDMPKQMEIRPDDSEEVVARKKRKLSMYRRQVRGRPPPVLLVARRAGDLRQHVHALDDLKCKLMGAFCNRGENPVKANKTRSTRAQALAQSVGVART